MARLNLFKPRRAYSSRAEYTGCLPSIDLGNQFYDPLKMPDLMVPPQAVFAEASKFGTVEKGVFLLDVEKATRAIYSSNTLSQRDLSLICSAYRDKKLVAVPSATETDKEEFVIAVKGRIIAAETTNKISPAAARMFHAAVERPKKVGFVSKLKAGFRAFRTGWRGAGLQPA